MLARRRGGGPVPFLWRRRPLCSPREHFSTHKRAHAAPRTRTMSATADAEGAGPPTAAAGVVEDAVDERRGDVMPPCSKHDT